LKTRFPAVSPPKNPFHRRSSLQQRLIINVGLLTLLGLGSITAWAVVQMRQQLMGSHKQRLETIAQRFPEQLATATATAASQAASAQEAEGAQVTSPQTSNFLQLSSVVQTSLSNITRRELLPDDVMVWVRDEQQRLLAQSAWAEQSSVSTQDLAPILGNQGMTRLVSWGDRSFLACRRRIPWPEASQSANGSPQYLDLYLAHDVTTQQKMIAQGLKQLLLADLLITSVLMGAIALIVRRGLSPIARINHLARDISASDLGQTYLAEDQAPREIQDLVEGFNAMLSRLSLAWQQQRQFVNDASHELRTPLTIVNGYLQSLLRRRQTLNPQQLEAVETAAEETQRTIQMLQEMLTLARADSGQLSCELQPVLLQPLLNDIKHRTQQIYQRSVRLVSAEASITALADLDNLHQILLCLIDNAVKYSDSQSEIGLHLASLPSETDESWITLAVIDQGIGIPPEQQRCIFERFYRADEARHRKGGTGLGLSLAKALAEAMKGRITVSSEPDQGSTFTLHLRSAEANQPTAGLSPTAAPAPKQSAAE